MAEENTTYQSPLRRPHRRAEEKEHDRFFKLRNILNIIFMLGAIVGMCLYFLTSYTTIGIIIILTAIVFKFTESTLRFIK